MYLPYRSRQSRAGASPLGSGNFSHEAKLFTSMDASRSMAYWRIVIVDDVLMVQVDCGTRASVIGKL